MPWESQGVSHLNHLGQAPAVGHLQQETKGRLSCPSRPGGQPQTTPAPPPTRAESTTLQFPPPHLYSQSKARWHTFRDLLLREPCTLEAMPPGDLRPHSRSPAPCTATSPPAKPVNLHFHPAAVWHTAGPQVRVGRKKDVAAAESRVEAGHLC